MRRLRWAFLIGLLVALLTMLESWILWNTSARIPLLLFNASGIVQLPGYLAGYAVSGNVHVASTWVVALANFVFYSCFTYLLLTVWARIKARATRPPIV